MKLLALSLALAAMLATSAASAGASPTTTRGFCGVARGVARDIVSSTRVANGRIAPANIKKTYLKIAAAEPALLAAAPGTVKVHLRPVFGFVNLVITDFEKVNWNPAGLSPYTPALLARARRVEPHIRPLKVYFHATCRLDV
jgi:hypothetical protein